MYLFVIYYLHGPSSDCRSRLADLVVFPQSGIINILLCAAADHKHLSHPCGEEDTHGKGEADKWAWEDFTMIPSHDCNP